MNSIIKGILICIVGALVIINYSTFNETNRTYKILHANNMDYHMSLDNNELLVYSKNYKLIDREKIFTDDERILSYDTGDLNNDGHDEIVVLGRKNSSSYGNNLVIFKYNNNFEKIYTKDFSILNPWKVQICNVDGDNVKEVSIGVYKKSKYHPVMAKRPFIYEYKNKKLFPKWRGSRLSKPFEDYIFVDVNKDNRHEIAAIELLKNGKKVFSCYKWKGFGFESIGQSKDFQDILSIEKSYENPNEFKVLLKEHGTLVKGIVSYDNNKLVINYENMLK
ncbi:MAG: VCBS repeat-containing protein [Anaeromicrobium sp.]|jgi:hypothetical protein|uniref:FG-GAP repeat domain-containing protein n=1 Tax=Anaeromicrobium sp. TaxID=1929132 RepID=UPI0025F70ACF|nr:VCBS repeat-containing protein [Anaeromicrobium sp.]MCT4594430.1 VCBS repeat-containing protein [Anaeromicrobium sp.]